MNESRQPQRTVKLAGRIVAYTVRVSRKARRSRIRVGPAGVEVVLPLDAAADRAEAFLRENAAWVLCQLEAADRLGTIRRPSESPPLNSILLRGERYPIEIVVDDTHRRHALIALEAGKLVVLRSPKLLGMEEVARKLVAARSPPRNRGPIIGAIN